MTCRPCTPLPQGRAIEDQQGIGGDHSPYVGPKPADR
jgi:hypothetical protein